MSEIENQRTIQSEYDRLKPERDPYLTKALEAAKYTIPSLISNDDQTKASVKVYTTPNQSIGADGVNNLSSKVTLTMLPPNQPFFKFGADMIQLKQEAEANGEDANEITEKFNNGLSMIESELMEDIESTSDRVCLGETIKHVLVAGNCMVVDVLKDGLKYYPLNRYIVKRDYSGNVLKAITKETVGFSALPEDVREALIERLKTKENKPDLEATDCTEKEFDLYTQFLRTPKAWLVSQEVEGLPIEKSKGRYPIDVCPFIALRYTRIDGESYGRGLIEEYIGDISYLDSLSLAIREASLAAAKLIFLVKPSSIVKVKDLSNTKNGGFVVGNPEDIKALQVEKYYDLNTARLEKESIEKRLYRIFLLVQSIQRDAERVTAEEIRQMVKDLEEALGNFYSILAKEFQLSYIKLKFFHLRKKKKKAIPDLIRDPNIKLTVTTGLEALGRGSDLNKWSIFLDMMAKFAQSAQLIGAKTEPLANIVAASLNLDIKGVMYTEEEKQKMQQDAQKAALMDKAASPLASKFGDMMHTKLKDNLQNGQQQPTEGETGQNG